MVLKIEDFLLAEIYINIYITINKIKTLVSTKFYPSKLRFNSDLLMILQDHTSSNQTVHVYGPFHFFVGLFACIFPNLVDDECLIVDT